MAVPLPESSALYVIPSSVSVIVTPRALLAALGDRERMAAVSARRNLPSSVLTSLRNRIEPLPAPRHASAHDLLFHEPCAGASRLTASAVSTGAVARAKA